MELMKPQTLTTNKYLKICKFPHYLSFLLVISLLKTINMVISKKVHMNQKKHFTSLFYFR